MFKVIDGFPDYKINESGQVRNVHTDRVKKPVLGKDNYWRIHLYKNKKPYSHLVHRLIAEAFIKNDNPEYDQVDHMDGNPQNNKISNLRWVNHNINQRNTYSVTSSTGHQGIFKNKNGFNAQVVLNKKRTVKYFRNLKDARAWRDNFVDLYYERP
jgi:hypothetical protein